jgi:hypothetical protein
MELSQGQDMQINCTGFYLEQCIANWTGQITGMDKLGGVVMNGKTADFYTRDD